ncbi:hypothetical protein [Qipengyuania spongiae]|uniref:Uncharacterized protein n=1 Tax=Qipengyuania spongiae TaxID=2909673 RepID=A0ABY5SZL5_9SPHN|nr:hypothetical protein [Qipengyuania spongiae]UVI39975.1 hypothetical protein L1F33_03180 [Qipengyuania spongiae]
MSKPPRILACALAVCGSPLAAQTIYYEDGSYLYAVPNDAAVTAQSEMNADTAPLLSEQPTAVRTIPSRARSAERAQIVLPDAPPSSALPVVLLTPPQGSVTPGTLTYGYGYPSPARGHLPNGAVLVEFDREAWLSECNARLGSYDESDQSRIIGNLFGTAAGGFSGNRFADGNRFSGTVVGADARGLRGGKIDDAMDRRTGRGAWAQANADRYCAAYLDDYLTRASNHGGHGIAYNPGQQYMLVPVSVPIARQVEYRDIVPAGS